MGELSTRGLVNSWLLYPLFKLLIILIFIVSHMWVTILKFHFFIYKSVESFDRNLFMHILYTTLFMNLLFPDMITCPILSTTLCKNHGLYKNTELAYIRRNLVRYVVHTYIVHRYIVQALLRIHECFKLLDSKRYNWII